jgi:hypothetical protein
MRIELCADAAAPACVPVPGGQALYFGADQPRVVAAALLPWQALGIAAPPKTIRVEIVARSWFRARWMSLSGRPPGAPVRRVALRLAR